MKKIHYLAYGSNLNLNDMKYRCPSAEKIGTTIINGYRLVFKGTNDGFAYLTIEKSEKDKIPVGIFLIDDEEIYKLDIYEGYPNLYYKSFFKIEYEKKEINALIYIMHNEFEYHIPSKTYMKKCREGYKDFNFDEFILNRALEDTKNNTKSNQYLL